MKRAVSKASAIVTDIRRQGLLDCRQQLADAVDDHQRVAGGRGEHAQVHRRIAVHQRAGLGGRGAQFDGADVAQAHQAVAIVADDHLAEVVDVGQVGVDPHVGHHVLPFHHARRRLVVVAADRLGHVGGGQAAPGQAVGVEPEAHRQVLAAEHFHLGHAVDGGEHRLDHPRQVVGQRRDGQGLAGKADVGDRGGLAGGALDHRVVGLLRQLVAHRVDLGHGLGHGLGRIAVEQHADGHHAAPLHRGGGKVVDALHRRHRLGDRLGDEALHQLGGGAGVLGGDGDGGAFQQRVLADRQLAQGQRAEQQDQGADHQRQHRPADEQVGKGHRGVSPQEPAWAAFNVSCATGSAAMPSLRLSCPEVTTRSPSCEALEDFDATVPALADPRPKRV